MAMTDRDPSACVALATGWKHVDFQNWLSPAGEKAWSPPAYTESIDLFVRDVVPVISAKGLEVEYIIKLAMILGLPGVSRWQCHNATAAQRCAAFLAVLRQQDADLREELQRIDNLDKGGNDR